MPDHDPPDWKIGSRVHARRGKYAGEDGYLREWLPHEGSWLFLSRGDVLKAHWSDLELSPEVPDVVPVPDAVDHPPHYNAHPSGVECIAIAEHFGFNLGNAIKYVWRSGLRGNDVEDLDKAIWYIRREVSNREAARAKGAKP